MSVSKLVEVGKHFSRTNICSNIILRSGVEEELCDKLTVVRSLPLVRREGDVTLLDLSSTFKSVKVWRAVHYYNLCKFSKWVLMTTAL
ncbi:hypothetical protein TSMEX_004644 [Taenia solium]|eukprot:TsM_000401900 transcript=TsM_000401900 gene=TsM_000401900